MTQRDQIRQRLLDSPDALIDGHTHVGVCLASYMTEGYPYCQSAVDLHGKLATIGFDYWVSFAMPTPVAFDLSGYRENELRPAGDGSAAPFEFENRRLMVEVYDLFDDLSQRFVCFAVVDPERRQPAQVEALTALAADYPVCGLKVAGSPVRSRTDRLLDDGSCLLDWAAERDLPVLMHSAVHPEDPWSQTDDLLRIVEARPALRCCIAHAARFDRSALDRIAQLDNAWFDTSAFGIHCDLAVQEHLSVVPRARRFPGDYTRPAEVLAALAERYPDKIIYGSDSPFESYSIRHRHADGRLETYALRSDLARETAYLRALPAPVVRRMAYHNTVRFLFGRRDDGRG